MEKHKACIWSRVSTTEQEIENQVAQLREWAGRRGLEIGRVADLYNNSPDFKANFDKIDPRLTGFMREAVEIYVKQRITR